MNKVAIVTGGSSGIGRAVSVALAEAGFQITIVGRTSEYINATLEKLNTLSLSDPPHLGLVLDVTSEDDMCKMVNSTLGRFGRVDLLIASAGIGKKYSSERVIPYSTATLPPDEWEEVIGVNLTGIFLSNRAVLATMISQRSGHIINICSSTTPRGLRGRPFAAAYSASKFGVVGLTESLAGEVAACGIRVQAVFPGAIETPLVDKTRLAQPFGGAISPTTFSKAIMYMITQPLDATIVHPHILPFRGAFAS
jgi:NAD(P)-dependent dehydrogenase (short-subunit alcohol dehydrogenase family)